MNGGDVKGRVIFVSSGAATGNIFGWAPYNASKAAVNGLCRCVPAQLPYPQSLNSVYAIRTLAQEEPDIVAVAVRPGKVDTAVCRVAFSFYHTYLIGVDSDAGPNPPAARYGQDASR